MTFYEVMMKMSISGKPVYSNSSYAIGFCCKGEFFIPYLILVYLLCFFSGQDVTLNATYSLGTSYDQQDNLQEEDYTDDVMNLGAEGYGEGYQQEGEEQYTEEYSQDNDAGMPEDQVDYTEGEGGCQDEVLDIQISEPIDSEFQVSSLNGLLNT